MADSEMTPHETRIVRTTGSTVLFGLIAIIAVIALMAVVS